ncbi:MAG: hypothetical protein WCZ72_00300 [Gemmobacter sp.]
MSKSEEKLSRRKLLARLGVAAGAAYVAPAMIGFGAASASGVSRFSRASRPSRGSRPSRPSGPSRPSRRYRGRRSDEAWHIQNWMRHLYGPR